MTNYDQPHSSLDHPAGEECTHENNTDWFTPPEHMHGPDDICPVIGCEILMTD